jgi:hypothetical protein
LHQLKLGTIRSPSNKGRLQFKLINRKPRTPVIQLGAFSDGASKTRRQLGHQAITLLRLAESPSTGWQQYEQWIGMLFHMLNASIARERRSRFSPVRRAFFTASAPRSAMCTYGVKRSRKEPISSGESPPTETYCAILISQRKDESLN